jgi:DNA-binding GntR family transcriptional regulator
MNNFEIPNHKPLREIVYEQLRLKILTGQLKPDTRLMEVELAEEMDVSRTPIREAIRKLEKEGLVIIKPRRGAYVSELSIKDMVEILEVRGNLDGLAASCAAERMTQEEREELIRISDKFIDAVERGDMSDMISYDTKFHHHIVVGSRNSHLVHMVGQLQEWVLRFRYIYFKDFKRAEEMPQEHKRIKSSLDKSSLLL